MIMAQAALDFAARLGVEPSPRIIAEINNLADMESAFEQAVQCARANDTAGYELAMARFRNLNETRKDAA